MPTDRQICDYVFDLARLKDVSQVEIATACGHTRAAVNNWKKKGIVPADNYAALAELLDTTVDAILTLGETAPVLSLTQEQLHSLPSDTQAIVNQAVQLIKTALANGHAAARPQFERRRG